MATLAWLFSLAVLLGDVWLMVWAWRLFKRDGISSLEDGPGPLDW